ncbi:hypothetical protein XELAEV_18041935mg [Xenopus laevis]|uniref:GIY-YIG domain-containing protein n=1 Tax=Xenopus laevis TaxID=8355 RepID=A0A974C3B1_XENLA|nr:hypothetical protein XELAEV_18041935mg [Xenopus laevis]
MSSKDFATSTLTSCFNNNKKKSILPPQPNFAYKKGRSLGSRLSPSLFTDSKPARLTHWLDTKGCYSCGVSYIRSLKYFIGSNNSIRYKINFYANCGTKLVIYLITCICELQYIGKTSRPVRKHISEHLNCL